MLIPATRPCLLAWVPRATTNRCPDNRCRDSTQSPAAHTPSTLVRMRASTATPPEVPSGIPASCARRTSGRTPRPSTTRSAGRARALPGAPAPGAPPGPHVDGGHAVGEDHVDPLLPDRLGDLRAHVGVEGADRGGGPVDPRDAGPAHPARVGDREPDVAPADDDHPAHGRPVQLCPQGRAVVED